MDYWSVRSSPLIATFTVVFEQKCEVGWSGKNKSKKKIGYLVYCAHNIYDMSLYLVFCVHNIFQMSLYFNVECVFYRK